MFEELHHIEVAIIEQEIAQLSPSHPTTDAHQKESTTRQGAGRQVLPANLPRIDHLHDLPQDQCQCKKCGFQLVKIGQDITEKLDVVPAQFIVHRHIKTAYLWAYCTSDIDSQGPPILLFDYQPGRHGEHAKQFLDNFSGHLMVDDYAGYKKLFKENPHIIELGCMVHARRKFFDFYHATESPIAKTALDFFACLYQIEGQAKEASVQERTEIRQKHALPVLEAMKKWLDEQALVVKSVKLGNTISYTLKRWVSLTRYAQDGSLPIDNNPVENHIRPIAIGKKKWLFVGCPKAG